MPLTHRFDNDAQVLIILGEGAITQPERLQLILACITDPAFRPGIDSFCDFSATRSTPTLAELREIIATISEHSQTIGFVRLAILTAKPITFAVAKVFEAFADVEEIPVQVKVFFNRATAWAWLRPGAPTTGGSSL